MIVLINLNDYLGGGETLMVRMASYLNHSNKEFRAICATNSYIKNDLEKEGITSILTIENKRADYYYLGTQDRKYLVDDILAMVSDCKEVSFITFCMRDLYTITQVAKQRKNCKVTHLVLHYQDNLYVCQSLKDKLVKKYTGKENYSRKSQIAFNNALFNMLCASNAIIPMSDLMVKFWNTKFGIRLKNETVVALPTYDFPEEKPAIPQNNHKIIFIGRIVDFKIPGLCVMLNYINCHPEYSLTIVGNGDMKTINDYIKKHNIDRSRLNFIGQVDYSNLGDIIKKHSIGYAMGTSVIEICRYGLPAVMALSTPEHQLFKRDICGGIYANCVRGNVGDNLFAGESEEDQPLLEDVMAEIESDYAKAADACYEYIKSDYDFTRNIKRYLEIVENAGVTDFSDFKIPVCSSIRKIVFKFK